MLIQPLTIAPTSHRTNTVDPAIHGVEMDDR
jgi:hypothetical protein